MNVCVNRHVCEATAIRYYYTFSTIAHNITKSIGHINSVNRKFMCISYQLLENDRNL